MAPPNDMAEKAITDPMTARINAYSAAETPDGLRSI